jgi:hypothetical protein
VEEAPEGDAPGGELGEQEYPIDELLLFLLENGLSEATIYGWHDGWHFSRLVDAFRYFKIRAVEKQRDRTLAVALGASSMLSKKPLEKFLKETDSTIEQSHSREKDATAMVQELNKMLGVLDG